MRIRSFGGPMSSQRTNRLRVKLYLAQQGCCGICGRKLNSLKHVTIDHVVPRALGAANEGNRVGAHRKCNETKGNRLPNGCELIWLNAVNARLAA